MPLFGLVNGVHLKGSVNEEQDWANQPGPSRRQVIKVGLAAALTAPAIAAAGPSAATSGTSAPTTPGEKPEGPAGDRAQGPPHPPGQSPWGYQTFKEPTPRPLSVRPGEQELPATPRKYTDIQSYHAHIYFDEDSLTVTYFGVGDGECGIQPAP